MRRLYVSRFFLQRATTRSVPYLVKLVVDLLEDEGLVVVHSKPSDNVNHYVADGQKGRVVSYHMWRKFVISALRE